MFGSLQFYMSFEHNRVNAQTFRANWAPKTIEATAAKFVTRFFDTKSIAIAAVFTAIFNSLQFTVVSLKSFDAITCVLSSLGSGAGTVVLAGIGVARV